MNWIWVFLGFRGRLSPKRFEEASSILFWVCFVPPGIFAFIWRPVPTPETFYMIILVYFFATIWPWLALTIKRLNDGERSILLAIPVALALPLAYALFLAAHGGVIGPPVSYAAYGIALLVFASSVLLQSKIGSVSGSTGPNRFGPEPID